MNHLRIEIEALNSNYVINMSCSLLPKLFLQTNSK